MFYFLASKEAKAVARLFETSPASWQADEYEASHACGVVLWIANGRGCLRWGVARRALDLPSRVNIWAHPDQRAIWRAYRRWQFARGLGALEAIERWEAV